MTTQPPTFNITSNFDLCQKLHCSFYLNFNTLTKTHSKLITFCDMLTQLPVYNVTFGKNWKDRKKITAFDKLSLVCTQTFYDIVNGLEMEYLCWEINTFCLSIQILFHIFTNLFHSLDLHSL